MQLYGKFIKLFFLLGIIYYLFNDIDMKILLVSLKGYAIFGIILSMLSVVISDFILGIRWQFLSKYRCSFMASFEVSVIAGFLNFILPAKLGEVSKLVYLKRLYNIRFSSSLIILFIERSMDVFVLALVTLMATNVFIDDKNAHNIAIFIIALMVLTVMLLNTSFLKSILNYIPMKSIRIILKRSVSNITRQLNQSGLLIGLGYSLLLWSSYFLTVWLFLEFAANIHLPLIDVFIVFTISSIAMSIPLAPGGVGTYQAGLIFALDLYGIDKESALVLGVILHIVLLVPSILLALWVIDKKSVSLEWFKKEKL